MSSVSTPTTAATACSVVCPEPLVCCPSSLPLRPLPWFRIAVGIFVACQTMVLGLTANLAGSDDPGALLLLRLGMLVATILVLLLLGFPLAVDAAGQLRRGVLSMGLFFLIGISAAFVVSVVSVIRREGPVYFEVVSILLVIYSVGQAINSHSRRRAIEAASALSQNASTARRLDSAGHEAMVTADTIEPGDRVKVLPGEIIPVDGCVTEGASLVRQTAFSGEWTSVVRQAGDNVLAGTAAEDGMLIVQASSPGRDRRVDRLSRLIQSACQGQTPMQRLAERFVAIFLPVVLVVALAAGTYWVWKDSWQQGLLVGLSVILVACPCAAGLAVPLTMWTLLGELARRGLVVRSAESIERLASVDTVIFDKTGTLADQMLQVQELTTDPNQHELALGLIAEIERHSTHPVARAMRPIAVSTRPPEIAIQAIRILPAMGIEADVRIAFPPDGDAGAEQTLRRARLVRQPSARNDGLLQIDLTLDGRWLATARLRERLRESAGLAVVRLRAMGFPVSIMTGDSSSAAQRAASLGELSQGVSPEQKLAEVQRLATSGRRVLYIGDGVNDAAAMAQAHSSIAMAHGDEVAVETASATLHGGDLSLVAQAIGLSRQAVRTVRSNLVFAAGYNLLGMTAAATGYLHPVLAAALMSASSLFVAWRGARMPLDQSPLAGAKDETEPVRSTAGGSDGIAGGGRGMISATVAWWHVAGLVGQALLLIPIARLSGGGAAILLGGTAIISLALLRGWARLPLWADHLLAMVSIGGVGMNLGWWLDLDLSSAIDPDGTVRSCCALSASLEATTHGSSHWMYWLMLLLGVPAMYVLRRAPERFSFRRWCCIGPLLLGVPGMCFGMWAGAQLATRLTGLDSQMQVLASYGLMMLGMCIGMLLPHVAELAVSRAWPRSPAAQQSLPPA